MSFQKRKTSYRKGVTSSVLDEYPLPEEGESLARIAASRGGNTFEVELPNGSKSLALLPTKFNKLVWMKRGDYVIVTNSDGQFTTASGKQNGVESMIQHILMKDQINYIKEQGKWPEEWKEESPAEKNVPAESAEEEYSDEDSDFSLGGNPNRRRLYVESDEDDEDDDCYVFFNKHYILRLLVKYPELHSYLQSNNSSLFYSSESFDT